RFISCGQIKDNFMQQKTSSSGRQPENEAPHCFKIEYRLRRADDGLLLKIITAGFFCFFKSSIESGSAKTEFLCSSVCPLFYYFVLNIFQCISIIAEFGFPSCISLHFLLQYIIIPAKLQ